MTAPVFDPIDFSNNDRPYEAGSGYVEKLQALSANFDEVAEYVAGVHMSIEDLHESLSAQGAEDRAVVEGLISTTEGALLAATQEDRDAAEAAALSAVNSALAAAEAVSTSTDSTARIAAIFSSRAISNVQAIAFFSNGGAGKKVQAPYVTETRPTGRCLGDYTSATAAWAANLGGVASAAGDYYWDTAAQEQRELTTLNNASVQYRGAQNYLPSDGVAIAHVTSGGTERLLIFDLTDPLVPLWMEFRASGLKMWAGTTSAGSFTESILRWDGLRLWAARNNGTGEGSQCIDFEADSLLQWRDSGLSAYAGGIHKRNADLGFKTINSSLVLDQNSSGLDATGGFAVFGTDGGIGVVSPDKGLTKSSSTTAYPGICIHRNRLYALRRNVTPDVVYDFGNLSDLVASFSSANSYTNAGYPYLGDADVREIRSAGDFIVVRNVNGLDLLWPSPSSKEDGLIARKGLNFATPPMKKPQLMLICSTVTGSVADTAEFTDDFAAGISPWTDYSTPAGTVTWDGANSRIQIYRAAGDQRGDARRTISGLTVGRMVAITLDVSGGGGTLYYLYLGTTDGGGELVNTTYTSGVTRLLITPTASTIYLRIVGYINAATVNVNDVNLRSIPDFSGLNNHATVSGALTATAEVAGGVAMLSGFTVNTNHVSAPNPWASVGSSDAVLYGAFKCAASTSDERIVSIGYFDGAAVLNAGISVSVTSAGVASVYVSNDAGATSVQASSTSTYDDGLVHSFFVRKTSTHYRLEIDEEEVAWVAVGTHGNLTFHASARLFVGRTASGASVAAAMSIAMIGGAITSISDEESSLIQKHMRNLILNKSVLDEVPYRVAYNAQLDSVEMVGSTYQQTMRDGAIVASTAHGLGGSTPFVGCGPRGEIGIGGTTGLTISVPTRNLRESIPTLSSEFRSFWTDELTLEGTVYWLPTGWTVEAVKLDGAEARPNKGSTVYDWALCRDSFRWGVDPTGSITDITVYARRST